MPSTNIARFQRWSTDEQRAIRYLRGAGYTLTRGWNWMAPNGGHQVTVKELDAILYLQEEWDFGPLLDGNVSFDVASEVEKLG